MRDRYKATWDYAWLTRAYLDRLKGMDGAVSGLLDKAADGGCCLLCFEEQADICHRSILAHEVKRRKGQQFKIEHL